MKNRLIDILNKSYADQYEKRGLLTAPHTADYLIENNVVEVVRCKDCIHWGGVTFDRVCKRWSGIDLKNHTQPMDYCSCGERKDGIE